MREQALETLFVHLEAGGGMTALAAMIGLSRPAPTPGSRLRQVLGTDLEQPRIRLSLHLVLLATGQDRDPADRRS